MSAPAVFFQIDQHRTSFSREILAGLTTFATMSYIVVVNPAILSVAGIPRGPSFVATVAVAVFGCLLMGVYANRPFAIAPYMGENAFIAFTVCNQLGFKWQTALAAVFIAGVIFVVITALRLREWVVQAVPQSLRYSFAVGIGLFLTLIGFIRTGIVAVGNADAPVRSGHLTSAPVLVAIAGFFLLAVLVMRKVPGAILLGILITAVIAFLAKVAAPPEHLMSMPPSLRPIVWQLDFHGALSPAGFPVVLTIFIMAFVDTMGTLIGLSARAGFLDEHGNLPRIKRPMMVDALTNCLAPAIGTTTSGAFVESATGIEAGGRTGLTAIVTAACFALTLFFAPLLTSIPPQAYGPALIIVGLFMLEPITRIDFRDYSESIPAFAVVTLMCFTFNIGVGVTAGFVLYPLCKLAVGKIGEVKPGMWILTGLSLLFFVFYPYG
jgi:AGZA family xanthine/uracil permease-like MFS transporter